MRVVNNPNEEQIANLIKNLGDSLIASVKRGDPVRIAVAHDTDDVKFHDTEAIWMGCTVTIEIGRPATVKKE